MAAQARRFKNRFYVGDEIDGPPNRRRQFGNVHIRRDTRESEQRPNRYPHSNTPAYDSDFAPEILDCGLHQ
jgi:hypothetical protein